MNDCLDENKILILNADDLNVSTNLTGLIAMGIAAKYKKPTLLGRISPDGFLKGSIRGREESALKDFKGFLKDSGLTDMVEGHANAAGFSLKENNVSKLYDYANRELKDIDFNEGYYEADFVVSGNYSDIGNLVTDLGTHADLWGQQNKEPVIIVENITIPKKSIQYIGSKKDTIKFIFNDMVYMIFKA
jgi:single-stranded-DNA-specific exonuclease